MPIRKVQEMEQPGEDKPSLVRAEIQGDTKPCSSVEEFIKPSRDVDEAMKAFRGHEGEVIKIDEATNKRLLRTIDWNLMPLMCVIYGLNFLDKTTLSYASVMGLNTDLNLLGDKYQG